MKDPPDDVSDGEVLSRILKDIRRLRGQTAQETARRMNLSLRTYERFEGGGTRLNQDYLHRFARATDSDANGILLAIVVRAPDFAIDGADNQLATVLTSGMSRFVRAQGSGVALLSARDVLEITGEMFSALARKIEEARLARSFIAEGQADLAATRPRPGR